MKTEKPKRKQNRAKATRAPSVRTLRSKAIKELGWKLKKTFPTGECAVKGCAGKTGSPRREWCLTHKAGVRIAQMRVNNRTWRRKKAQSTKSPRVRRVA